jgi:hypothetical protein
MSKELGDCFLRRREEILRHFIPYFAGDFEQDVIMQEVFQAEQAFLVKCI